MDKSRKSGIDIDLGNQCSRTAYCWAKKTFSHRPEGSGNPLMTVDGAFSNVMNYHGVKIGITSDGIGTKIEIAERTGIYDTLGFDLVAMTADDLVANGIEPVNLSNILDVDYLDHEIVDALMRGLYRAAKEARITVTGGEIAELGNRIQGYGDRMHFNWCSTAVGLIPENADLIEGTTIQPGNIVIALASRGFRSNGFSLIRQVMEKAFGNEWHTATYSHEQTWGEILLTPSRIYTPLIVDILHANIPLYGLAHITGGGIGDNFARVLKSSGYGANLNTLFKSHPVMLTLQQMGDIPEQTAYRLWNMGNGMLLVTEKEALKSILDLANTYHYPAQLAGVITPEPYILLSTSGCFPQRLEFPLE
ncbi:MAG: AIR synthase-related protein [Candidatus Marinimicrobia bacterium]|nr:AIR synthase-related protein [Candidatus Neomarinimicrobiota bacterium]